MNEERERDMAVKVKKGIFREGIGEGGLRFVCLCCREGLAMMRKERERESHYHFRTTPVVEYTRDTRQCLNG